MAIHSESERDVAGASGDRVGVVVIGRNEGERLKRCIESLLSQGASPLVYVDSGSTDGSVEYARSKNVEVVNLDMSRPFTMGRGRNAGFDFLSGLGRDLKWVQFVDGDCEIFQGWIEAARSFLDSHPDVAAVAGRLSERYPDASIYNRLFDMECDVPPGETDACGGPAMYRVEVLKQVGAFNEGMIAGEEPELCVRIRRSGSKIWRLDERMGLHDAAMERFAQWWTRTIRGGHAYAEGFALQGFTPERHRAHQLGSCLFYGLALPCFTMSSIAFGTWVLPSVTLVRLGLALQAVAMLKVGAGAYAHRRKVGDSRQNSSLYATFCAIGKVPEALGALKYARNRLRGMRTELIEYRRA